MPGNVLADLYVFTHVTPGSAFVLYWLGCDRKWQVEPEGLTEDILRKGLLAEVCLPRCRPVLVTLSSPLLLPACYG